MRKITKSAIEAFISSTPFNGDNTRIIVGETTQLLLFNNLIAEKTKDGLFITNAGWQSNTTKERLNAIPGVNISQKKGVWYLNGNQWDGKLTQIKSQQ